MSIIIKNVVDSSLIAEILVVETVVVVTLPALAAEENIFYC